MPESTHRDENAPEESQEDRLAEEYRQMAADQDREMEAEEWCEGILFDIE